LDTERGVYMNKCKTIRVKMNDHFDRAIEKGISKKLLKLIVKERELERRIKGLTHDLELDEKNEHQMLMEKLGEFANTPLGKAALAAAAPHVPVADGKDMTAQAGA
jgi:hypothetical protein